MPLITAKPELKFEKIRFKISTELLAVERACY